MIEHCIVKPIVNLDQDQWLKQEDVSLDLAKTTCLQISLLQNHSYKNSVPNCHAPIIFSRRHVPIATRFIPIEVVLMIMQVGLNLSFDEVVSFIKARMGKVIDMNGCVGAITTFIVEPFVPHKQEFYLCLQTQRLGTDISFSPAGGVEIEENWDKVKKVTVPTMEEASGDVLSPLLQDVPMEQREKLISFIKGCFKVNKITSHYLQSHRPTLWFDLWDFLIKPLLTETFTIQWPLTRICATICLYWTVLMANMLYWVSSVVRQKIASTKWRALTEQSSGSSRFV